MVEDEDHRVRHEALLGLLQQGPQSLTPAIVNLLRRLLCASSGNQRARLLDSISRENRRTAEHFLTLMLPELLADGEVQVRLRAATFLAQQIEDEEQWARFLPGLLRDQSATVRRIGLGLLKRFRAVYLDERLLGALLDLLARRDHLEVWDAGLDLLRQRFLPRQRQSVRWLLASMLSGSGESVAEAGRSQTCPRMALLEVCRRLGPDLFEDGPGRGTGTSANDLLEQMASLLKEPRIEVRRLAGRLVLDFARLGKEQRLLGRLGDCTSDRDEGVRELALAALERLQEIESPEST
jgi:hypothetical protein